MCSNVTKLAFLLVEQGSNILFLSDTILMWVCVIPSSLQSSHSVEVSITYLVIAGL